MAVSDDTGEALPAWHARLWTHAQRTLAADRMPHAILVCGPPGVGKRRFAAQLVAAMLCRNRGASGEPCHDCTGCRLRAAGTHPDMSWLVPEENSRVIKVEQVREFSRRLSLTAQYAQGRAGWIEPAEALSESAANSLLKTLEEPPAGCHIVLIADRISALMATIVSRCQQWRVPPPDAAAGRRWLESRGVDVGDLDDVAVRRPLTALEQAERDAPTMAARWDDALVDLVRNRKDAVGVAEDMASQPADLWLDWIGRRASALAVGAHSGAHQAGLTAELRAIAQRLDPAAFEPWLARVAALPRLAQTNADWRLVVESTLLDFKHHLKRRQRAR